MLRIVIAWIVLGVTGAFSGVAVSRCLDVAMPLNLAALGASGLALGLAVACLRASLRRSEPRGGPLVRSALAAVRVVLLVLLSAWLVARAPAPMGEGPAGPPVAAEAFEQVWREGPVLMVSLGDSVSTGFGVRQGLGYFALLRENDDETYPEMRGRDLASVCPDLDELRLAKDSTHSLDHLGVIERMKVAEADVFGLVCITTGGIDLIHDYGRSEPEEGAAYGASLEQAEPWIERFELRLDRMVVTLKEKFPGGLAVLLATIYDPTDGVGDIDHAGPMFWLPAWPDALQIHGRFNEAIRQVAARHEHVHLADMHEALLGHGIHCRDEENPYHDADDPTYWYYLNLEDPNRRGYDAIRRVFLNAIVGAMAPAGS